MESAATPLGNMAVLRAEVAPSSEKEGPVPAIVLIIPEASIFADREIFEVR